MEAVGSSILYPYCTDGQVSLRPIIPKNLRPIIEKVKRIQARSRQPESHPHSRELFFGSLAKAGYNA
jgi:hypothetical protein